MLRQIKNYISAAVSFYHNGQTDGKGFTLKPLLLPGKLLKWEKQR